jgi:hypothetical protein
LAVVGDASCAHRSPHQCGRIRPGVEVAPDRGRPAASASAGRPEKGFPSAGSYPPLRESSGRAADGRLRARCGGRCDTSRRLRARLRVRRRRPPGR